MAMTKLAWIDAVVRRAETHGSVLQRSSLSVLESMTVRQLGEVENLLAMAMDEMSLSAAARTSGEARSLAIRARGLKPVVLDDGTVEEELTDREFANLQASQRSRR